MSIIDYSLSRFFRIHLRSVCVLGSLWWILGTYISRWRRLGNDVGLSWGILEPLGSILRALGRSLRGLESILRTLRAILRALRDILRAFERSGKHLRGSWRLLDSIVGAQETSKPKSNGTNGNGPVTQGGYSERV